MSSQSDIDRNIRKVRELVARDRSLSEVVEQIAKVRRTIKRIGGGSSEGRLILPYVNAEPMREIPWISWK